MFGIVVPTYVYDQRRKPLIVRTFQSLRQTILPDGEPVKLLVVERLTDFVVPDMSDVFDYRHAGDPPGVGGPDTPLLWGAEQLFGEGADHVVWLNDDAVFNPAWLVQLKALIGRHPEAKAWSVYHSAHTNAHQELAHENGDVLVRSVCGIGMTLSKEEFADWGIAGYRGTWGSPGGDTIDLFHAHNRPGERWVTEQSYINHIGTEFGIHVLSPTHEVAKNWMGED